MYVNITRKLFYRKDYRAMRLIYIILLRVDLRVSMDVNVVKKRKIL